MDASLPEEDSSSKLASSVVSYRNQGGKHKYRINKEETEISISSLFNWMENLLRSLSSVSTATNIEHVTESFRDAGKFCKKIFNAFYCGESDAPIFNDIYEGFTWNDGFAQDQTSTIEKTEEEIILIYEFGFFADEEVLTVDPTEGYTNKGCTTGCSIRQAAAGIPAEHFPDDPERTQEWRQNNPSKIQLSISGNNNTI